jgi:DivIVA domain-containing protein
VIWVVLTVVAVLVVGVFAALATGRLGYDPMAEPTTSQGAPYLSEEFGSADISAVRFDTALRGYRMDQVDAVLERLQARIAELESPGSHDLHR